MDRVLPTTVIAGCSPADVAAGAFAGLVVGWIHKPAALGLERPYGAGRLVATTFRLFRDAPLADPAATALLDALVALASGARAAGAEDARSEGEAA
jgi:hypothetical protein